MTCETAGLNVHDAIRTRLAPNIEGLMRSDVIVDMFPLPLRLAEGEQLEVAPDSIRRIPR